LTLAREIAGGVWDTFGVALTPEPVLVGPVWSEPRTVVKYDNFRAV
jgi:hypothetical protein